MVGLHMGGLRHPPYAFRVPRFSEVQQSGLQSRKTAAKNTEQGFLSESDYANAMLMMWMENILTDGEYNRIMYKLNKSEMCKRYMNGET